MKQLATLALAAVVFGAYELPASTATQSEAVTQHTSFAITATAAEVESYVLVLENITTHLLPGMENQDFAGEVRAHLQTLAIAMSAGQAVTARSAVTSARALVENFGSMATAADDAELGAMSRDLAAADRMFGLQ